MRILHLANTVLRHGDGIASVVVDLACAQARAGHDVIVASRANAYTDLLQSAGVTCLELDARPRGLADGLRVGRRMREMCSEAEVDVVHSHVIAATVLARFFVPAPVIATVHNEHQRGVWLMRSAHHVVGVSHAVTGAMRNRAISPRRLHTVYNGVYESQRLSETDLGAGAGRSSDEEGLRDDPYFLAIGSVSHRKGSDVLVRAHALLLERGVNCRLVFAGNVDWQEVPRLTQVLGSAAKVEFLGSRPAPWALARGAIAVVMPSRREPLGLGLIESLLEGAAGIGADVGGIPEGLAYGAAGTLVAPDRPDMLADAMQRQFDEPVSDHMRDESTAHAREVFSVARMVSSYEDIYSLACAR